MATKSTLTARHNVRAERFRKAVAGSSLWGFADQALISATTFVTMAALARELGARDFGTFTLAYTIIMVANNLQSSLITTPQNVLGSALTTDAFAQFTKSNAALQLLLVTAITMCILVGAVATWKVDHRWSILLACVSLAVVSWQLQEFTRRVLYTKGRGLAAFINDLISYGGQALGVIVLWRVDRLSEISALLLISATSALGMVHGLIQISRHLGATLSREAISDLLYRNWHFGKWLLGSTLVSWLSSQLYPVLTAGLVSVAATGATRAVQTLLGPTHILLKGIDVVYLPRAAAKYETGGMPALSSYVRGIALITAPLMGIYCLVIAAFAPQVVRMLFGDEYVEYSWLVVVYSITYLLMYFSKLATTILGSAKMTAPMFHAYASSAVIVLTLGVSAVYRFGLAGAAAGIVVHSLVLNIVLWRRIWKLKEDSR